MTADFVFVVQSEVELSVTPRFVALFAFIVAVAVGSLWEIFEYFMDSIFGLQMQKPMLSDLSGLTDSMWHMIVNTIGAPGCRLFVIR